MGVIELIPNEILANPDLIEWIELDEDEIEYWAGGKKHTVKYNSDAEALQAYRHWIDTVGRVVAPDDLQPGELVLVDREGDKNSPQSPVKFVASPSDKRPYWVFEDLDGQYKIYVWEQATVVKRQD